MKWFNRKNNLDEMQELKLLKLESRGFWLGFIGLFLSIVVQIVIYGSENTREVYAGEFIVFLCMGIYLTGGFIMLSQITLLRSLSDFATAFQSMLRSSAVLIAESLILIFLLSVSSRIRQHHS